MSKADDLRKKMENRGTTQVFTPRQSVNVQPIPQKQDDKPKAEQESKALRVTAKPTPKPAKLKPQPESDELVALFAKVPKEDKRWLDHHRIDTGKDLGVLISEAIDLLRKNAGH
jgi:hypothetical protein